MLEIKREDMTILVSAPYSEKHYSAVKYSLCGFYPHNSKTLYDVDGSDKCSVPEGYTKVKIYEHFTRLVRQTAMETLAKYLEQHREDTSIYSDDQFWSRGIHRAGITANGKEQVYFDIYCHAITQGIVHVRFQPQCEGGSFTAHYDFLQGAFQEEPERIMKAYYGANLNYFLATSQKEPFKAKQYAELERINAFLKDKQSVTVILKDGTNMRIAPKYSLSASKLIQLSGQNRLYLCLDFPYGTDDIERRRRIGNLAALKHGHKVLEVNSQNLRGVEYLCGKERISA